MNRSDAVERFYTTWTWRKCRKSFLESRGKLCEDCLKEGIVNPGSKEQPLEVHHKIPITDDNINDPSVTLNWDNLEAVCKRHHDLKKERKAKRWRVDEFGNVTILPPG